MPLWNPESIWKDQDVFVIGGGASLKAFDWNLLKHECTIGCNDAYALGHVVCKVCVFGDSKWFGVHEGPLSRYKGALFTNAFQFAKTDIPWLWTLPREEVGLYHKALGWNRNTGAVAINLALILGAKRVLLLGFDMHPTKGRSNWHDNLIDKRQDEIYDRFLAAFHRLPGDLEKKFPGSAIINITDDSSLDTFPKVGVKEFFMERKVAA